MYYLKERKEELKEMMGERVTFDPFDRQAYTSDFFEVPSIVNGFFATLPEAVVKPATEEHISFTLRFCNAHSIPVTPRAGGSSGLMGAVPKRGGIVIDLRDLNQIIRTDREKKTVTVRAGITMAELDEGLAREGLALKSYPSSALSATPGGWAAGSGLGLGSLKHGYLRDQTLLADIALPNGSIRTFSKATGLDDFFESEGRLGIITRMTLEVREVPTSASRHLLALDSFDLLVAFIRNLLKGPRPFAVEIFDHIYCALLRKSGYEAPDTRPGQSVVLVAYEGEPNEISQGEESIDAAVQAGIGQRLAGAEREWAERYNIFRIRRAVPDLIPASVYLPIDALPTFYEKLPNTRQIALSGHLVSPDRFMLLPLIAVDKTKLAHYLTTLPIPYHLSRLALSLGGQPGGGVGVWNASFEEEVLGVEKSRNIRKRKKEYDPNNTLNPGMWSQSPVLFKSPLLPMMMKAGAALSGLTRSDLAGTPGSEWDACVQCGYCTEKCPTKGLWISSSPRGRILSAKRFLAGSSNGAALVPRPAADSIFSCTLCGRCRIGCSVSIRSPELWVDLRNKLTDHAMQPGSLSNFVQMIETNHNTAGKPNQQRLQWAKRLKTDIPERASAPLLYFAGCVTSFYPMVQDIARSFCQLLVMAQEEFTVVGGEEWCCGYALLSAGEEEKGIRFMAHNIELAGALGAKTVAVTCPGCYRMWNEEYSRLTGKKHNFQILHSTQLILKFLKQNRLRLGNVEKIVTYHDPCDLGRMSGLFDEPRAILSKIPGIELRELKNNREYGSCCGSGGDLLAFNSDLAIDIARRKIKEALEVKAEGLVSACPSCVRSLNIAKATEAPKMEVLDIVQVVLRAVTQRQHEN